MISRGALFCMSPENPNLKISIIIPVLNETPTIARVISTAPGRATQMNAGAAAATGDILLFLHADTLLPRGYDDSARRALANPSAVAGAFELKIDASRLSLRLVETGVNWRSNFLPMPYGDQGILLKAAIFDKI